MFWAWEAVGKIDNAGFRPELENGPNSKEGSLNQTKRAREMQEIWSNQ